MSHLPPQVARRGHAVVVGLTLALAGCVEPAAPAHAPADGASVAVDDAVAAAPDRGQVVPPGVATLSYPTRVALAGDVVYVSDPVAGAVFGYADGRRVFELTGLSRPLGLAVRGDTLAVGCAGRGTVELYDLDSGRWSGDLGAGPGEVTRPNAISIAPDGVVYVADSDADRVRAYDLATRSPRPPLGGDGELRFPAAVAADDAVVVVADQGHHRLVVYGRDGALRGTLGHALPTTVRSRLDFRGGFTRLQGVALGPDRIYALDAHHGHVEAFTRRGEWVGAVGRLGACPGCVSLPLDVAVRPDGRVVVTDPERARWLDLGLVTGEGAP